MSRVISIDPITRLEGHGKIVIFLDDEGEVHRAMLQLPDLRGFEAFVVGRPAEEMPQITSRICGVCPMAHHMAATKALDALFGVEPPAAARAVRELAYMLFIFEDHALHFYFLGGPDLIVGPEAPPERRNIVGFIEEIGAEQGRQVIATRQRVRALMETIAGKAIHPVFGLPGGISKPLSETLRAEIRSVGREAVALALESLDLFHRRVIGDDRWLELITEDFYALQTYSMGLVDEEGKVALYDGTLRVVTPDGREHARFPASEFLDHIGAHVEPWTYSRFPFLLDPGWRGFVEGPDSGIYRVAPLARLNVAEGMATPRAQAEYEQLYETLGARPLHYTLANHWARLVELLFAAERISQLAELPELTSPDVRNMDLQTPSLGVGVVEAPRGTLIHRYETDDQGLITSCHMIVATEGNAAALDMSIEKAAKGLIHGGHADQAILDMVEMAFRAYDPCLSCTTHALPGGMPLLVELRNERGELLERITRP